MSDMPYQRVLPMNELQRKTKDAMVKRKEKEGVPTDGVDDKIYSMSEADMGQVLRDLKRVQRLVIFDEKTNTEIVYEPEVLKLASASDAEVLFRKIAGENQALYDYLLKYFHQGGFQNSAEFMLSNYFTVGQDESDKLILSAGPLSRWANFRLKEDGTIGFEESYEIIQVKNQDAENLQIDEYADHRAMARVTCQSTLALNDNGQVVQTYGDVNLSASHPKMQELFNQVAPLDKPNLILIAQRALDELKNSKKDSDKEYYQELTEKYKLNAEKIILYAKTFFEQSNSNNEYASFNDFLAKHFSKPEGKEPIANYIGYLTGRQTYGVNTINAGSGMPIVSNILGIYRHGYIQFYDSPFANGQQPHNRQHEILELNPAAQTDEYGARTVIGQVNVVPGIVTMALHLSAKERLDSGEYKLQNYRPWVNDCQTYLAHAQEGMNNILASVDPDSGKALKQTVIDHYRFRPEVSKKQAQWLRRQAGEHLNPENEIFEMGKKGLHAKTVPVEPNLSAADLMLTHDRRNAVWDRKVKESPSKNIHRYVPWLMTQFARSIIDRTKKYAQYKVAEHRCKGHLQGLAKHLKQQERFMNEMPNTIMFDTMNMKIGQNHSYAMGAFWAKIATAQGSILKHSSEMSVILINLQKDPFNTNLNVELDNLKKLVIQDSNKLKTEIQNLSKYILENNISAPKEQKNCQDAIKDLQKYQNTLVKKCNSALLVGVRKQNKENLQTDVQVAPTVSVILSGDPKIKSESSRLSRAERPASGILSFSKLAPKASNEGAQGGKKRLGGDTPHPNTNKRQRVEKNQKPK